MIEWVEQREISVSDMTTSLKNLWIQQNRLNSRRKNQEEELNDMGAMTSGYTPAIYDLIELVKEYSSSEYFGIRQKLRGKSKDEVRDELRKTQNTNVNTLNEGDILEYARMQCIVLLATENNEYKSFLLDFLSLDENVQSEVIREITEHEAEFFRENEVLPDTFSIKNIMRVIRNKLGNN